MRKEIERLKAHNQLLTSSNQGLKHRLKQVQRIAEDLRTDRNRYLDALTKEALQKAERWTVECSTYSGAVGTLQVVGGMIFTIGCDERANITAKEAGTDAAK